MKSPWDADKGVITGQMRFSFLSLSELIAPPFGVGINDGLLSYAMSSACCAWCRERWSVLFCERSSLPMAWCKTSTSP